jgi:23S rRNA (uridine2552-2'-O)-methyltransferase
MTGRSGKSISKSTGKSSGKLAAKLAGKLRGKAAAKPPKPAAKPQKRSAARQVNRPAVSPAVKATGKVTGNTSGNPTGTGAATVGAPRLMKQRLKTARGRTVSQQRWLERQLNDPFVAAAKAQGYRSRAAFKLAQIDDKARLLRPGMIILDLGAAPGGWSQIAAERVKAGLPGKGGHVVAVDLTPVEPMPGVTVMIQDFMEPDAEAKIEAELRAAGAASGNGKVHGVFSDMAASSTGHKLTDHLRIMDLCEAALYFAERVVAPGGFFLCKVLQGGSEGELLVRMKRSFRSVKHIKPAASRADSSELYVLATGFRGMPDAPVDDV